MSLPVMKPDRRRTRRTKLQALAYINFEIDNGGIVLNISEEGLCFHSVAPVQRDGRIPFWFSANGERIDGEGHVAWTDERQRTGGVRFSTLSSQALNQVHLWTGEPGKPFATERKPTAPVLRPEGLAHSAAGIIPVGGSDALNAVSEWVRAPLRRAEFSRGLLTGLLIGLVVAAGLLADTHRHQFGAWLIRMGQRFEAASQPQPQRTPTVAQTTTPSAPVAVPHTAGQPHASVPSRTRPYH